MTIFECFRLEIKTIEADIYQKIQSNVLFMNYSFLISLMKKDKIYAKLIWSVNFD